MISNKEELKSLINRLEQIPYNQIVIEYENDLWDGPSEGVCKWKNKKYYFIWYGGMDEEKDEMIRKFLVIDLTKEQWLEENKEHTQFMRFSEKGQLEEFYKEQESYPEYKVDQIQLIGWFSDER